MNSGRVTIESVQFEIISWILDDVPVASQRCLAATEPARPLWTADFFLTALPFLIKFFFLLML